MKPLDFVHNDFLYQLYNGDSIRVLKERVKTCSLDAVIEDPPYGMNPVKINIQDFMNCYLNDIPYSRNGKGIANQEWDKQFPSIDYFKQVHRVLKHGGFYIGFCSGTNIGLFQLGAMCAGLEIIDLGAWFYGKGMGTGRKVLDHTASNTSSIKDPRYTLAKAFEPILIARKPTENGLTVSKNFKKYGTGVINNSEASYFLEKTLRMPTHSFSDGSIAIKELFGEYSKFAKVCSSNLLDQIFAHPKPRQIEKNFGIFEENPCYSIQNVLVAGLRNEHLTIKPIELMSSLIKTFTKKGDTVFDGYLGSGTTAISCLLTERNFIGAELSSVYFDMASSRFEQIQLLRQKHPTASLEQLLLLFEEQFLTKKLKGLAAMIAKNKVEIDVIEQYRKTNIRIQQIREQLLKTQHAA